MRYVIQESDFHASLPYLPLFLNEKDCSSFPCLILWLKKTRKTTTVLQPKDEQEVLVKNYY